MAGAFEDKIEPGINEPSDRYSGPTLTVTPTTVPLFEEVTASVQSQQTTDIAAQIQARIKAIHVKSGDSIEPGDLLITLDDQNLRAINAQAQNNVNALNARLNSAKSHFNRTLGLYNTESATLADLETAKADYESLKAQRAAAQQKLNETRHVLDYSRITATFAARVIDRYAQPGDIALPGKKLLAVYDSASLRFEAPVRESVAVGLKVGQILEAHIDALNKAMPVTIAQIVPLAEPGARSVLIKTRAEHQPGLLPGMFARLRIPQGEEQVLLIPQDYVHQVGQLDVVWVAQDKQIIRRFVRLGRTLPDGRVKVTAGLTAGEQLIAPARALAPD